MTDLVTVSTEYSTVPVFIVILWEFRLWNDMVSFQVVFTEAELAVWSARYVTLTPKS
jgi:hypothetical protein